ncbi:unnamed protein product [Sympodiomycopsis kandeliae]
MSTALPKAEKVESDDELFENDLYADDSSSDEDAAETTQSSRRVGYSKQHKDFEMGMVLTTPRIIQQTVGQLYEDMENGDIDLEPDYQRNVVWTEEKQSNLVSSLLSHFYIPPILLSQHPSTSSGNQYTCIDGKQRLSSIKLFMQNNIAVYDAAKVKFYYSAKGQRKRALPPEVAKRFRRESVPVVIYENLTDAQEREMFQRVQMGVTLSPAEKLSALRTPWTICFDQLAKRYMDSSRPGQSLCHIVRTSRSNDWLFMGQIAMTILNQDKKPFLAHFANVKTFVEKEPSPTAHQKKQIFEALNRLLVVANNPEYNGPLIRQEVGGHTKMQLSPVEFVHVAFMCWRHPTASYTELSQWTKKLRVDIHKAFPGQVRYNGPCATLLRDLIESFRPSGQGEGSSRPSKRRYEDDEMDYHPSHDSDRRRLNDNSGRPSGRTTFFSGTNGSGSSTDTRGEGASTTRGSQAPPSASKTSQRSASTASGRPLFRGSESPEVVPVSQSSAQAVANSLAVNSSNLTTSSSFVPVAAGSGAPSSAMANGFPASRRITPQNPYS